MSQTHSSDLFRRWLFPLGRLLFPHYCAVCGAVLRQEEDALCLLCNAGLPRTGFAELPENPVERLFWGRVPVVRAASWIYYHRGSEYIQLLFKLKYRGRRDLGVSLGRMMAAELQPVGLFEDVDLLLPVPLYGRRQRERGYNQSERLAEGVSRVTGLPVDTASLRRVVDTGTQTARGAVERMDAMHGAFALAPGARLDGLHVLLIDDVLTTGATLTACADALLAVPGIRISVLALASAE